VARYLVRRLFTSLLVIVAVATLAFALIHLLPCDPTATILGTEANPQTRLALRHELRLDRPLLVQYGDWWWRLMHGDLGRSVSIKQTVASLILNRLPTTIPLAALSILFALIIAVPAGVISALKRNSWLDALVSLCAFAGLSVPSFWLGILLILAFSLRLGWFPPGGYVNIGAHPFAGLRYLILPAVALGATFAASVTRMIRSSLLEVLGQDYIRTARAKGVTNRVVIVEHALRNALIPAVTIIGVQVSSLLSGALIIEEVFALPGLGRLTVHAVLDRDFPLLQGCMLVIASIFVLANLLTDFLYVALDPRIHYT
jgi:peptide/nickel transport system permease protein